MRTQEDKLNFIKARAEGKSYDLIAKDMDISKSTLIAWGKELNNEIAEYKQENLKELYDSYFMTKEARIRKLGNTLNKINDAIDKADFSTLSLDKLLDYKLKYTDTLKEEYISPLTPLTAINILDSREIIVSLQDLLNRVRCGEISQDQASREAGILTDLLKAYDVMELEKKVEALEVVLDSRGN